MGNRKAKPEEKSTWDTWLKIIPILLTAISLAFGIYQWYETHQRTESEKDTWKQKKQTYQGLLSLIGEIGANKDNDSLLLAYSKNFDKFYLSTMKQAEGNDSLLTLQMMIMRKDIHNTLSHKSDYYQADKLGKTCKKLSDLISAAIENGDKQY